MSRRATQDATGGSCNRARRVTTSVRTVVAMMASRRIQRRYGMHSATERGFPDCAGGSYVLAMTVVTARPVMYTTVLHRGAGHYSSDTGAHSPGGPMPE